MVSPKAKDVAAGILDRLLITLAVRVHAFALCEIKQGWRLNFEPMEGVTFHYVLAGTGTVRIGTGASAAFTPQCIVIAPARVSQSLGEAQDVLGEATADDHCSLIDGNLVKFTAGDGSRDTLIACGTISATYGGALGLFDHLREPIVENAAEIETLTHVFATLLAEMSKPGVGTQALTEALMKQCLILLLRRHWTRFSVDSPFFAPLQDHRLARAITGILERPSAPHSVGSLAALAGMSRSAFSERFTQVYSQGPMEFVQQVRLRLGAHFLTTTDLPVKVIARSVGYASRSYFSTAFRNAYGTDPKSFRAIGGSSEREPTQVEPLSIMESIARHSA